MFGNEKELQSDGTLMTTTTMAAATTRRLQTDTQQQQPQQQLGVTERVFESGQHARPKPEPGYILAQTFPTAVIVSYPIGQTCLKTAFTESADGTAQTNVTCADGMRGPVCSQCDVGFYRTTPDGLCQRCVSMVLQIAYAALGFLALQVMVIFYTAMNSVPLEDDEKTHVVAIHQSTQPCSVLLNFMSLIGFIGMINISSLELPENFPSIDELIPGIPSINGVLSTDCILEPLLLAAGYPQDEAFIILKIGNTLKMVVSGLFLTLFGASIVFGTACLKSYRRFEAKRHRRRLHKAGHPIEGDDLTEGGLGWGSVSGHPGEFAGLLEDEMDEGEGNTNRGAMSTRSNRSIWGNVELFKSKEEAQKEKEIVKARGNQEREQDRRMRAAALSESQQRQLIRLQIWRRWNQRVLGIWRYDFPVPPQVTEPKGFREFRRLLRCLMEDMISVYIVLFFLTFEGSLEELLGVLRCEPLAEGLETRVASAPSVSYTDEVYIRWSGIAATAMVLLGIVIPLLMGVALMTELHRLRLESNRPLRANFRRRFGFLIQGFRPGFEYWELTIIIRKLLLQLCLAFYLGENANMRLSQAVWLAVFSFLVQSRLRPFNSQDNDILNQLESQALAFWLLSLVLFQMLVMETMTSLQNLAVLAIILALNGTFLVRIGGVIATGYVLDFCLFFREIDKASDPSAVLPIAFIRVPFLWVVPVIKKVMRPVESLIDNMVSKDTLQLVDSEEASRGSLDEAKSAAESGGALTEASVSISTFLLARCGKVFEGNRGISKEESRETLLEIDSVVSDILVKWDTELASNRRKEVGSALSNRPPSFRNQMASIRRLPSFGAKISRRSIHPGSSSKKRRTIAQGTQMNVEMGLEAKEDKWKKFEPPEFFDEFLFRWAVVCSQRLVADEELAASAEGVNDLDELLWIAQRLLRPPVEAKDDHPFVKEDTAEGSVGTDNKTTGGVPVEEEETEGENGDAAHDRFISGRAEVGEQSEVVSLTGAESAKKTKTAVAPLTRRGAFDIAGERWDPLCRDEQAVAALTWADRSFVPVTGAEKGSPFGKPASLSPTKEKKDQSFVSRRSVGYSPDSGQSKRNSGGRSRQSAGAEFRIDIAELKEKRKGGKGTDVEAPRRLSSSSSIYNAPETLPSTNSFLRFLKSVRLMGGGKGSIGRDESSPSFFGSDFSPSSVRDDSSFVSSSSSSSGRVFGCVVPERLKRSGFPLRPSQLQKVGEAFFSFGQNSALLESATDLDNVLRALRTFLYIHPVVVLWHYLCFMGVKRQLLNKAAMGVVARWIRYLRDRVARPAVNPPMPGLHDASASLSLSEEEKRSQSAGGSSSESLGSNVLDVGIEVWRSAVKMALTAARDQAKTRGVRPNFRFVEDVFIRKRTIREGEEPYMLSDFAFVELALSDHFGMTHSRRGNEAGEYEVDSVHGLVLECWLPLAPGARLTEEFEEETADRLNFQNLFGEMDEDEEEEEGRISDESKQWEGRPFAAGGGEDEAYSVSASNPDAVVAFQPERVESPPANPDASPEGSSEEEEEEEEDDDEEGEEEEEEKETEVVPVREEEEEEEEEEEQKGGVGLCIPPAGLSAMQLYDGVALGTRSRLPTFRSHAEGSSRPFRLKEETERVNRGAANITTIDRESSEEEANKEEEQS
uniref:TRP C-terminal domain-containing protein n=1 Tax=Chromera velia CCMP2878 TaxID=1169474 RepID=A0A0G4HTG5_9ALVE|eukprot:Cvel_8407.t1-p1 / transcript=Cvel_8407.t1 / gene=Cvel_8407 / organism=Chromera_velia_CCMP2878 / gene_product=hypothetical protein / transcript_product=hypothetical protein / location=Cvel_scaffold464:28416-40082(-) / protein_length=1647 / sequence_SO=supercontig / SO=protein_coding / is_pseudo=false